MTVIGLVGTLGSGKDTVAGMIAPRHLVEADGGLFTVRRGGPFPALRPRGVQIALADPMKVFLRKIYGFTVETLWGSSKHRNAPDHRYPRRARHQWDWDPAEERFVCKRCGQEGSVQNDLAEEAVAFACQDYLTAREALQQLGTEWGRRMWEDTWIRAGLELADRLRGSPQIAKPAHAHTFAASYALDIIDTVVISDVRFVNEARALREAGAQVWRLLRTSDERSTHASELEQDSEAMRQYVTREINNTGTLEELYATVRVALMS